MVGPVGSSDADAEDGSRPGDALKAILMTDRLTESDRAAHIARLVGIVQRMVEESGDPTGFDAAHWTAAFLARPNHALGGHLPSECMRTERGRAIVERLLLSMQSGAYL